MAFGYGVYFTERDRNRVIRWDPDRNTTEVLAGEPRCGDAGQELNDPYSLAFGRDGVLLIADKLNHRICRLVQGRLEVLATKDTDGHRQRTPDSPAYHSPDQPKSPSSMLVEEDGSILCTYFDDHTIYRIHPGGRLELVLGRVPNRPYFHDAP